MDDYRKLQQRLAERWRVLHEEPTAPQDVVVVPSLSLEGVYGSSIRGVRHYEERLLFTLNLLRFPRTRVVYLSSMPIDETIVDYVLSLIGGIPAAHMRKRLVMLSTQDASPHCLTEKILARPRLLARLRDWIRPELAHLTCFTVSAAEQQLALELGIPLYGVHPELLWLGTKSGSRRVFREAGVPLPAGAEDLFEESQLIDAIGQLLRTDPDLRKVVLKLNTGFSGQGNAVLELDRVRAQASQGTALEQAILQALPSLRFGDRSQNWLSYLERVKQGGAIVEAFIEGETKTIPSGQLRISPLGTVDPVSTHEQVAEDPDGQVYGGCRFPASEAYRHEIMKASLAVGKSLQAHRAVGRFAVDFLCVQRPEGHWSHYAIEINLRLGGTTHPMMLMQMMTHGHYDRDTGLYLTPRGEAQYYSASDSLPVGHNKGLLPEDLLDIAALRNLHYQTWNESGVLFHMMGALSEFGKLGITAIGKTPDEASSWFEATKSALREP